MRHLLSRMQARYEAMHPKLVVAPPHAYADGTCVFDVFAYYRGEKDVSDADPGTLLRFVERPAAAAAGGEAPLPLPGLERVAATFEPNVLPAYCDHWVSNVISRVGFLKTLVVDTDSAFVSEHFCLDIADALGAAYYALPKLEESAFAAFIASIAAR